jgi:hypothetical protein
MVMGQPQPGAASPPVYSSREHFEKNPRAVWIAIFSLVAAVLVVLALFAIEIPHSYSFTMNGPELPAGTPAFQNHSFPAGSDVSGAWSTSCTAAPVFAIFTGPPPFDPNWTGVYHGGTSNGAFGFRSSGDPYTFEFYCNENSYTVSISGTYSMPLL